MSHPNQLPVIFIACKVFESMLNTEQQESLFDQVTYLDYGLHRVPDKLTHTLQEAIDEVREPSLIVLGYGLCGNGLKGIQSRKHTLLIPRTDDCIAILLGSYQSYLKHFNQEPGTYYLTKGWLEAGSDPLKEYREVREKYGEEDAQWIMDTQYQHYKRLVLVAHQQDELEEYRPRAQEVAAYCSRWGMDYQEILGSDRYLARLLETAASLDKADEDFLVIPPQNEIRQEMFVR
ncbi:MAG: DUF1638 domain-containing protein [Anaerolineales bacterium]|nr:DUF1638 domain-containing protein [Anaerolineales bacterium]MBS3752609.1 DUF1638 domain-containing protein [Anaerolineales bacterium]